jgi:hypothetical protein
MTAYTQSIFKFGPKSSSGMGFRENHLKKYAELEISKILDTLVSFKSVVPKFIVLTRRSEFIECRRTAHTRLKQQANRKQT